MWKEFFFFARRWSQLSTSVISPSLNLFAHQVHRYHLSGASFQMVMWSLFSFVPLLPAAQRKTVTEMPTVTSLSKIMIAVCFWSSHRTLSHFSVFLSLHSYHDLPPLCRPRGRHVPRAPCAGRHGEIWRKREQESTVVQARRERGDDYQGFK